MEALGLDVLFMGSNATRLLQGLWVAVQISAISVVLSIILGMLFGIFMTWKNPVAKVISRLYLEIVRIMPQLVLLYIVFFGATCYGPEYLGGAFLHHRIRVLGNRRNGRLGSRRPYQHPKAAVRKRRCAGSE